MKRAVPFLMAGALAACGTSSQVVKLNAGGATFPAPLYQAWFAELAKDGKVQVNYQATGSGSGVRQFNAGTTDFGASDKAIGDKRIQSPVVQIPVTGGAIVPAYNNLGCDLKLTQKQLADVFLGNITNWNQIGCDDKKILVVYRSDGSGTTAAFTASLAAFSPEWKEQVGVGKSVKWPVGVGAKGNSGVAGQLRIQDGSIGYVNYGYVLDGTLQQAALQNRAGNFVTANAETSAAGLSRIKLDDKLRGKNPNPRGKNSYPIVSLTWILARPVHPQNEAMKEAFTYMLSDEAQSMSDGLGYVPLPESIRVQARAAVESLRR